MKRHLTAAQFTGTGRQIPHMDGTHRTAYDQSGQVKDGIGREIPHSAVVDDIDRIDVTGSVRFQS